MRFCPDEPAGWALATGLAPMSLWLVRAGRAGEREALAMAHGIAAVGWDEVPDLAPCTSRVDLDSLLKAAYPDQKARTLNNWHGQLWALRDTMRAGDLVVMPLKTRPIVVLGVVAGEYAYRSDLPGGAVHSRPVEWLTQVPRRAFDVDILLSFGAFMTVCRVERNDAEQRVRALLATTGADRGGPVVPTTLPRSAPVPDLEERSQAMIRERIAQKFKGHHLASLVAALLEAQGYRARVSPPGADGGVDILAGSGPLGFDAPRLVVQVKSQDTKVDVRLLRELAGVMGRFQADHGLLVGWGGFNQPVRTEAAADYFRIRLWDAADIVAAVKEHYARLPPGVRADIPLKQVWTLVPNEAGVAA